MRLDGNVSLFCHRRIPSVGSFTSFSGLLMPLSRKTLELDMFPALVIRT